MERTKSIPQQQAWVTTHKKRIIKHLDQLIGKLIREREAIALTLSGTRKAVGPHQQYGLLSAASGTDPGRSVHGSNTRPLSAARCLDALTPRLPVRGTVPSR